MVDHGASYLDFGAESTRPGATPLAADDEWARLEPTLARAIDKYAGDPIRPRISVDTYHVEVARRALALGADLINDVSGLTQPDMVELAASSSAEFVAMHNLGLPADPQATLSAARGTVEQIEEWLDGQLERWRSHGLELDRIVFDPGIGFGKTPLQSLELLREARRFAGRGLRLLIGHSRKSFMSGFAGDDMRTRDLVTVGGSLALCAQGIDVLRVHNVADHAAAYRGWAHSRPTGG
jgi:dihydropteroate synthase